MTAICQGTIGKCEHLLQFKDEIADLIDHSTQRVMRTELHLFNASMFQR